jgi:hypothetical protein
MSRRSSRRWCASLVLLSFDKVSSRARSSSANSGFGGLASIKNPVGYLTTSPSGNPGKSLERLGGDDYTFVGLRFCDASVAWSAGGSVETQGNQMESSHRGLVLHSVRSHFRPHD